MPSDKSEKKITDSILARIAAAFAAVAYGIQNPTGQLPTGTLRSLGDASSPSFDNVRMPSRGPMLLEGGTRRQRRGNRKHRSRSNKTRKNGGV